MNTLNKVTYETKTFKIIIQRFGDKWLLQVFEGAGGTQVHEWGEFHDFNIVNDYVVKEYLNEEEIA